MYTQLQHPGWQGVGESYRLPLMRAFNVTLLPYVIIEVVREQDEEGNDTATTSTTTTTTTTILPPPVQALQAYCHQLLEEEEGRERTQASSSSSGGGGGNDEAVLSLSNRALELSETGEMVLSLHLFSDALQLNPYHVASNYNVGALLHMLGQPRVAIRYLMRVVEEKPDDATAHHVLGSVLYELEPEVVVGMYRDVVRRRPENRRAAHWLACLTGEGESAVSASPDYVREVFDNLAPTFEDKLVNHLNYRVSSSSSSSSRGDRDSRPPPLFAVVI